MGLIDAVAAEANHETNRTRRKRLDAAFEALSGAPQVDGSGSADPGLPTRLTLVKSPPKKIAGRWRITELDLWDLDALDLVGPAYIEFDKQGSGEFGFIAVTGWLDCRHTSTDGRPSVEFSREGHDDRPGQRARPGSPPR